MDISLSIAPSNSSSSCTSTNHLTELFDLKRLSELYVSEALMDIKLIAGTPENRTEIKAHRVILSLASQYFYDLFKNSTRIVSQYKVYGIDPESLNSIIAYIYTGRLLISEENIGALYQASELLDIAKVKEECQAFVLNNIDDDNWGRRLEFSQRHNFLDLSDVVVSYITKDEKYIYFMETPQFLELDYDNVVTLLNAPARLETPEESIFTCVLKWLKFKEDDRIKLAGKLLKQLDLASLPQDFLQFHVEKEAILHTFDFLQQYKKTVNSLSHDVDEELNRDIQGRTNGTLMDEIYVPNQLSQSPHEILDQTQKDKDDSPPSKKAKLSRSRSTKSNDNEENETGTDNPILNLNSSPNIPEPDPEPSPKKSTARKKTGGLRHQYAALRSASANKGMKEKEAKVPSSKGSDKSTRAISNSTRNSKTNETEKEKVTAIVPPTKSTLPPISPVTLNTHPNSVPVLSPKPNSSLTSNPDPSPNPVSNLDSNSVLVPDSNPIATNETPNPIVLPSTTVIVSPKSKSTAGLHGKTSKRTTTETTNEVVVYLREYSGEARVYMTDLCMKHPRQLRPFFRNNKSPALVWSSSARRLYALGGLSSVFKEAGSSQDVRYSPEVNLMKNVDKEKYWMKGPQMIQERSKFKAVVLGDYIYAFGGAEGVAGNEAVNCAEKLSLIDKNPKWEEIDFLQRARHGFGAGIINGKIYVCGGYGATTGENDAKMGILDTVECYDVEKDEWKFVTTMYHERHNLAVTVLDSKLYAIGGGGVKSHTDPEADLGNMTSVEVYDPRDNTWNLIANLNRPRKNGSAVTLNGKVYAIGGDYSSGKEDKVESSVEVYCPEEDKWTMVTEKLDPEGNFSTLAVIDLKDR